MTVGGDAIRRGPLRLRRHLFSKPFLDGPKHLPCGLTLTFS